MQIAKKDSDHASITYAEALDEALCFGWIDGQKKRFDDQSWLQKFTKRDPRSVWSKTNVGHVERLAREGRLTPAGLAAVEGAKAQGRWATAYEGARTAEMPPDFMAALAKHNQAKAFFETLNKTNRYAIYFRVTTAKKPQTRAKRIADLVALLGRGEKLH